MDDRSTENRHCFICKQDFKLFPTDLHDDQVTKRLEDLHIIFGVHEYLRTGSNNIKDRSSTQNNLPCEVNKKPTVAIDTLDLIGTLNSIGKEQEQEFLLKSTILDNMKEHLSMLSMVTL